MTVFVIRNGQLVEKKVGPRLPGGPYISRMEPFESPVTGKEISTWREREADMRAVDAYDPRDVSTPLSRDRSVQAKEPDDASRSNDTFQWRNPAD